MAVPIISNPVNVQIGALANVIIMLCITVWALYLIFHNKRAITQGLSILPTARCRSSACLFALLRWSGTGLRHFIVLFSFVFDPGNSLSL